MLGGFFIKRIWQNVGVKVSIITIVINFGLFLFKLLVGIFAHSTAMISDGIHSLSDVLSTIIVIFGLLVSNKKEDAKHPYGHERIESVLAIILAFMLFLTGVYIGYLGLVTILNSSKEVLLIPGVMAVICAIVSIVVKELMFRYTIKVAKKINSLSMEADAWHHRSDALSSIGSMLGVIGARMGLPILDPLCSIVICFLIVKTAWDIFKEAIGGVLDMACDKNMENNILMTLKSINPKGDIIDLKTRLFGSKIYVEVTVGVKEDISLKEVMKIRNTIHDKIEAKYKEIKHCSIEVVLNE